MWHRSERTTRRDPQTGQLVTQWTNASGNSQHLYFTSPSVTADGRYLVTISERDGAPNLYTIAKSDGRIRCLTKAQSVLRTYVFPTGSSTGLSKVSPCLHAASGNLFWIEDNRVLRMNVGDESAESKEIAELPAGWLTAYMGVSKDGKKLCVPCAHPGVISISDFTQHEQLHRIPQRMLARKLNTRIYVIDVETKVCQLRSEIPFWVTHVQFDPQNTNNILCNCEGHMGSRGNRLYPFWGRLWGIDANGGWRRLYRQPIGERINHENWTPDGSAFVYHGTSVVSKKAKLMNAFGRSARKIGVKCDDWIASTYSHFVEARTWDGRRLWRKEMALPVSHAVALSEKAFVVDSRRGILALYERRGHDEWAERVLCSHGSSMAHQDAHPHPSAAHGGMSIVFSSDSKGVVNVFEVELGQTERTC